MGKWLWLVAIVALVVSIGWQVASQEGAEPRARGERVRRARLSPEEMRQRMEQRQRERIERMREELKASAEDWQVLGPAIQKVLDAQQEIRRYTGRGMMMGFGGRARGAPAAGSGAGAPTGRTGARVREVAEDSPLRSLSELTRQEGASPAQLKAALAKLRKDREAKRAALKKLQKSLQELVTPRQEALLVLSGILE